MTLALIVFDVLLAFGLTLRLTRFVVADDVPGTWWIKDPLEDRRTAYLRKHDGREPRWSRYLEGLSCPYCMSVWFAAAAVASLALAGGPGEAADWWRYVAGALSLAWIVGHVADRAGDTY